MLRRNSQSATKNPTGVWILSNARIFEVTTTDEILGIVAEAVQPTEEGELAPRTPTELEIVEFLAELDVDALSESLTRLTAVLGPGARWSSLDLPVRLVGKYDAQEGVREIGLEEIHSRWTGMSAEHRPRHPLGPLVSAWQQSPHSITPERRRRGIMPSPFATRISRVEQIGCAQFDPPSGLPGHGVPSSKIAPAPFPGLEPGAPPQPALILGLFDHAAEISTLGNGKLGAAPRIFLEALLGVPVDARDGRPYRCIYDVKEIVVQWLGWDPHNYRPSHPDYGGILRSACEGLRGMSVPVGAKGGFYYPLMLGAGTGWGLDDRLEFIVRLPPSEVGPPVDREMLRRLGSHAPAYRAYLSLIFEWDRFGGRNGRLIKPTVPVVERGADGVILDHRNRPVTGKGGRPVKSPLHPRAVRTGPREPNPARTRYPWYDYDGLVRLAYPAWVAEHPDRRKTMRQRAIKAIKRIEEMGGCVIELSGNGRGRRWRVMPPDRDPE